MDNIFVYFQSTFNKYNAFNIYVIINSLAIRTPTNDATPRIIEICPNTLLNLFKGKIKHNTEFCTDL